MSDRTRLIKMDPEGYVSSPLYSTNSGRRSGFFLGLQEKAVGFVLRVLSLVSTDGWRDDSADSHAGETVNEASLLGLSAGWACINLIAGVTGTLPCNVRRRNPQSGVEEVVEGHWLGMLFEGPNADQTCVDLWEFVAASLELRGNAYYWKRRNGSGRIIALDPILPGSVEVRRAPNGRLRYRFLDIDGNRQDLDQEDVWHIRGFGGSPLGGLSTLAFGRHAFGLALAIDKSAGTTFRNGVRPSGVLKFKDWLKPDRRAAAYDKLVSDHTSAAKAGKPLVLEGGVEWQQISFSPEDAQMLQSRTFSVEEVCRFFGVPPVLIGHTEKVSAWGSGIQEITLGFVKFALRRRLKRIEKSAERQLLSAEERGQGYRVRFDLEGLLRGDPKGRAEFYEIMTRIGVYSIDYVCGLENVPPPPNGAGSVPRVQMQNVPLTSLNVTVPSATPSPPANG